MIFSTLHSLLIQRQDLLEAMGGTDFVLGFMQSVDGEKDPTNLIMIFQASPLYSSVDDEVHSLKKVVFLFTDVACYHSQASPRTT